MTEYQFRSLATADPSLVAQTTSFLAAARAESDNAKKPKTSGFIKPKDDDWTLPHLLLLFMCDVCNFSVSYWGKYARNKMALIFHIIYVWLLIGVQYEDQVRVVFDWGQNRLVAAVAVVSTIMKAGAKMKVLLSDSPKHSSIFAGIKLINIMSGIQATLATDSHFCISKGWNWNQWQRDWCILTNNNKLLPDHSNVIPFVNQNFQILHLLKRWIWNVAGSVAAVMPLETN